MGPTEQAIPSSSAHVAGASALRAALWLGATCIAAGVLGWTWELLARQAPSSPWHVAGFPAAIERFALHAWVYGLGVFALVPRAFRAGLGARVVLARAVVAAGWVGATLALGALAYAASRGVMGVQVRDSSPAGHGVFLARMTGEALLLASLVVVLVNAVRAGSDGDGA